MFSFLHKKIVSLWHFIKPKKKLGLVSFTFLAVLIFTVWLLFTDLASADLIDKTLEVLSDVFSNFTLWIAGLLLKLTIFALKFIIELGGYNGYLDSQAVTVGWVMVRDVVNMGFVVILLIIAFGTILGLEQYEWKKLIVKFILAAVLVNFSRTICGLIIDAAQVVMTTFVNGVAATAGGNLINAFNADEIMSLANGTSAAQVSGQNVFMASIAALVFSVMMLMTMVIYLVILLFRMISLWVLIVLSPIAFVASVIPQTQKYASEWWKEFGNNVISGPLIVFFLWLAFVTVGAGDVHKQIFENNSVPESSLIKDENSAALSDIEAVGTKDSQAAGITSVMTWDSMANFFIAIAMLVVGAKKAQELGVMGGSMMGKVTEFGKKAAMIATGAAAGIWAAKGIGAGVKKGVGMVGKNVFKNIPLVGGRSWVRLGKRLDDWRRSGKYIKNIPVIGGAYEEKQDKLDYRIEKEMKWKKESRLAQFSHPEMEGWLDRMGMRVSKGTGGLVGFGLGHASFKKNQAEVENVYAMLQKKSKGMNRSERAKVTYEEIAKDMIEDFKKLEATGDTSYDSKDRAFERWQEKKENKGKGRAEFMSDPKGQNNRFWQFCASIRGKKGALTDLNGEVKLGITEKPMDEEYAKAAVGDAMRDIYFNQSLAANKKKAEEARTDAMAAMGLTNFGSQMLAAEEVATMGKTIGENIQKEIKQAKIDVEFDKAKKALEGAVGNPAALQSLIATNKFAAAIHYDQLAKAQEGEAKAARAQAEKNYGTVEDNRWLSGGAMTARMRLAEAETSTQAAESYFKTLKHNAPRYNDAAKELISFKNEMARPGITDTEKAGLERDLDDLLKNDAYASAVYFDQLSKREETETTAGRSAVLEQVGKTDIGRQMIEAIADAEVGTKLGEDFLNVVKNERWQEKHREAEVAILGAKTEEERAALVKKDAYVHALKVSQDAAWRTMISNTAKQESGSAVKAAYIDKNIFGQGIPSTAMANLGDTVVKSWNMQDEPGRGAAAARTIAVAVQAVQKAKQKAKEEGKEAYEVSYDQQIALFAAVKNMVENGNFDDGGEAMANSFNAYEQGDDAFKNSEEGQQIKTMMEIFGEGGEFNVGVQRRLKKDNKGRIVKKDGSTMTQAAYKKLSSAEQNQLLKEHGKMEYAGSEETVGALQNWMLSGGNSAAVRTHYAIDKFMEDNNIKDYSEGSKRWFADTESKNGYGKLKNTAEYLGSAQDLEQVFIANRTKLLEGAEGFKRDGYNTGHTENSGHQVSDVRFGGVRFSRRSEAKDVVTANDRKRPGNQKKNTHSFGRYNNHTGVLENTYLHAFTDSLGRSKRYSDLQGILDRTVNGLTGALATEDVETDKTTGHGFMVSKDKEVVKARFGSTDNFIATKILPGLMGGMEAFNNIIHKRFGIGDWQDAEEGYQKIKIIDSEAAEGTKGREIETTHVAEMVEQIMTKYGDKMEEFASTLSAQEGRKITANEIRETLASRLQQARELKGRLEARGGGDQAQKVGGKGTKGRKRKAREGGEPPPEGGG